jgi:hypothetical protein
MGFRLMSRPGHPTFTDLPWEQPLDEWSGGRIVTPVRGISRHVVCFVAYGDDLYALKETQLPIAQREYRLLRELDARGVPVVEAVGVASGRVANDGTELDAVLITRHLDFSLPYRALFSRGSMAELWQPMLDALAELLVRMHLAGFFWGDCSLSNALFRRDAGRLAATLVDAETGEMHDSLSGGQRAHDLEIAEVNVAGELLDLSLGGGQDLDPIAFARDLMLRYQGLWDELTHDEVVEVGDSRAIDARVRRLNALGFDVAEIVLDEADNGSRLRLRTAVVEPGHHRRRLLTLTGLDVQENQARRLLNDIRSHRAIWSREIGHQLGENLVAMRWMAEVFQPTIDVVPVELHAKLEPAELYHQLLEHRWYLSEHAGHDVGATATIASYVDQVLLALPDEQHAVADSLDLEDPLDEDPLDEDQLDSDQLDDDRVASPSRSVAT